MFPYSELLEVVKQDLASATGCEATKANLLVSLFAKLAPSGLTEQMNSRALKDFLEVDNGLPTSFASDDARINELFTLMKGDLLTVLSDAWGERSLREVIHTRLAIGPGASLKTDSRSFYTKLFNGPLTTTNPFLFDLVASSLQESPLWREAESFRRAHTEPFRLVEGNSLFFVLKNAEISRTACTEPLVNMMVQQALAAHITQEVLPRWGIRLATQQFANRRAALDASASGKSCTIDLRSASNCTGVPLCTNLLKGSALLSAMMVSRSPATILPDGTLHDLRMISSMGNAFTFPLETLIFASAVRACYALHGYRHGRGDRDYFVFGDDIICRKEVFEDLITLLGFLGFKVNVKKTFSEGPFRESCGVDAWNGVDIRGVFIKSLETDHHIYSAFNRLARWEARHGIPLRKTLEFLLARCKCVFLIPFSEVDSSGIKVPAAVYRGRGGLFGVRTFKKLSFRTPSLDVPQQFKREGGYNPAGLELSFIAGAIESAGAGWKMPIRPRNPDMLWHPRTSFTFDWNWNPAVFPQELTTEFWWEDDSFQNRLTLSQEEYQRWKTLVAYAFNLIA